MVKNIHHIKCFMLDMDGTFYLGEKLLPGALEFMKFIKEKELDYLFLTNNSSKHGGIYAEKIRKMGFDVDKKKIFTSGEATTIYLKKKTDYRAVFVVGTTALEEEFVHAGFTLTNEHPDAVVLGFDTTLTYEKIWKLCDFVREGLPFIATHPDYNCPTESGFMPDIGSFIALVEASTGKLPNVVVGKPHTHMVEAVVDKTGFGLDEIAMIGDRLYTDIALGRAGIMTILVLSGETKEEDLKSSEFQPDMVFRDLAGLVEHLKNKPLAEFIEANGY